MPVKAARLRGLEVGLIVDAMTRNNTLLHRLVPRWLHSRLSGRVVLQKILSNSGWLLADQMLRIGLGAVLSIWVARYLGPERLGALNYAIALATLGAPIATFGLESLVVRDLVRTPEQRQRILASTVALRLATGAISILAAIALALLVRPQDNETHLLVLIVSSAALFQAMSSLDFWFQSGLKSKFSVMARDLAFLASASFKIWCILHHAPLELFALAVLVEATVSATAFWALFRLVNEGALDFRQVSWSTMRSYILEARSLVLTGLLVAVYMRVDRVIIGSVLSNRALGLYSVAAQLCELFYIFPTVVTNSLYPVFVNLHGSDEALYTRRLIQAMRLFFYVGLAIAILFSLAANRFVIALFGPTFSDAVQVARVYIFVLPLVGMSIIFTHRYVLTGTTRLSLIGVAVGSFATVALNLLVVPTYGLVGAACVVLVSQVLPTAAVTILGDRSVGAIFLKAMLPRWK